MLVVPLPAFEKITVTPTLKKGVQGGIQSTSSLLSISRLRVDFFFCVLHVWVSFLYIAGCEVPGSSETQVPSAIVTMYVAPPLELHQDRPPNKPLSPNRQTHVMLIFQ